MSPTRVQITYSAPLQYLSSDHWSQIHSGLLSQLPLRSLLWKPASRLSVRTILELEVDLVALESVRDESVSQIPLTLLERPFLNLYVVACEDNDTYKNLVKKQIKDWLVAVGQRKHQEWLIVYVVRPDGRPNAGGLLKMRGTILDRIKADFNVDKKDRCVQLNWSNGADSPTAWADVMKKIKEGITTAFDTAVAQREEEVKRSESQRQMPGWNFCTFFVLKESLAISFEGMNLLEDAQIQYDELEASFFHVLKDKNLSWFGRVIDPAPVDDSLPLLSVTKKAYRDLILANTISVFDFRVYLLSRQCILLGNMGKVVDAARKACAFLNTFGQRLREIEEGLPEFFVESWTYYSALSVVESCDQWAQAFEFDTTTVARLNGAKGELMELARSQLDRLGVQLGYLPNKQPFPNLKRHSKQPTSPVSPTTSRKRISGNITNSEIISCLTEKSTFYDLFVRITNRAIDMYAKAGRRKFALKLHGSLAALDFHRERFSQALSTYSSLPAHYAPHRWTSLETCMLYKSLETRVSMGAPNDREWLQTSLSFLKVSVADPGSDVLMIGEDRDAYLTRLVAAVCDAISVLETDLHFQDHPMISIDTGKDGARLAETQDGFHLDAVVQCHLPCDLLVDSITLTMAGRDTERLEFSANKIMLTPGCNKVLLFCPIPLSGVFLLESSEVRIGRLILDWTRPDVTRRRRSTLLTQKETPKPVRLPKDPRAFSVSVEQPRSVHLGSPASLLLSVKTGRNKISRVVIKISSPEVQFTHINGALSGDSRGVLVDFLHDQVVLQHADNEQTISFLIPHSGAGGFDSVRTVVDVEYRTESEPELLRKISASTKVATLLAIAVNVQDFFRGRKIFSKFTVSTTTHQHVRISSVHLQVDAADSDNLTVSGCSNHARVVMTATPGQPADFIFNLQSKGDEVKHPLELCITYRQLREEVEGLVSRHVGRLAVEPSIPDFHDTVHDLIIRALENNSQWVEMYQVTGELVVPSTTTEVEAIREAVEHVTERIRTDTNGAREGDNWRQVVIPVDVPRASVLAAACIYLLANPFSTDPVPVEKLPSLYAGQPIPAVLSIQTSFHWGKREDRSVDSYHMQFEVEEMIKDWLISGQKRGDFVAKHDSTHTVPISLIALHHGEMTLPRITVTAHAIPTTDQTMKAAMASTSVETYQVNGAEKVLVLPRGGRTTFMLSMSRDS